jgi:hypothetical protein
MADSGECGISFKKKRGKIMKHTTMIFVVLSCILICTKNSHGVEISKNTHVWSNVYLGIVPGHQLSMYKIPYQQEILDINQTFLSEFTLYINFHRYLTVFGGVSTYSFKNANILNFYPCRSDFRTGVKLNYKFVSFEYEHGCYHPMSPNCPEMPLPQVDASQDRFGINFAIGKEPQKLL